MGRWLKWSVRASKQSLISAYPEVIPVEMCYLGWKESLAQLANLVEPEMS
jgi:hypothetical protein